DVLEQSERFLKTIPNVYNSTFNVMNKLALADKYNLQKTTNDILASINSVEQIKYFKENCDYRELSDDTKLAIFERSKEIAWIK
ncbi:hypothetical protein PMAYCL1PPCAC_25477, partial [Pristionchus mayeri]